jgi:sugar-specific transcriptional regulator TrmB
LRSITKNRQVPKILGPTEIQKWVQKNPDYPISKELSRKMKKGYKIGKTRFSYTPEGIKLVVILTKDNIQTKINFSTAPIQDFSSIKSIINFITPGAKEGDFISAINLSNWMIKNLSEENIARVWNDFIEDIKNQGLSEEDQKIGVEKIQNILFPKLSEISSGGGGSFTGSGNGFVKTPIYKRRTKMDLQEKKLREYVRGLLREHKNLQKVLELTEAKSNVPDTTNPSTGINVLEDLLKKIIPSLEKDYKVLTSSKKQRQSFRAHMVNAISRSLSTMSVNSGALLDAPDGQMREAEVQVGVSNPRDNKFIDIQKATKKPTDAEKRQKFSLPGQDETGRNLALESFSRMEKQINDAYSILNDEEDRRIFRDYLLTNIKLYFDKFEDELSPSVQEPTTPEYEQEKGGNSQGLQEPGFSL